MPGAGRATERKLNAETDNGLDNGEGSRPVTSKEYRSQSCSEEARCRN